MKSILIKNKKYSDLSDILFHNTNITTEDNIHVGIVTDLVEYNGYEYLVTWNENGNDIDYDYSFYYYDCFSGDDFYNKPSSNTNLITIHGEDYTSLDIFEKGIHGLNRKKMNKIGSGYVSNDTTNLFLLSQTLFGWNKFGDIRMWNEYGNIHHKLSHNYKLGLFFGRVTKYRTSLVRELSKLNEVFINQFNDISSNNLKVEGVTQFNKISIDNDFDNLSLLTERPFPIDFFFRTLPNTKAVISIETIDIDNNPYNFLTEKTYGLILGGIPFIPSQSFILDMLSHIGFEPHPFEKEIYKFKNNPTTISKFIELYLKNEESNYIILNNWVRTAKEYIMNKLYSENSLLDNLNFFKKTQ